MRLTFDTLAEHLGSPLRKKGLILTGVVTDSRKASPGDLFVCIPGKRVDGHNFAHAAAERGATALLASRDIPELEIPVLRVEDTVKSLGAIAALWRAKTTARVIGVTGTAGKTTLKDVLAQVLSVRGKTIKSPLNNNNQIGLPCAMLAAAGDEAFWVMEAGISHAGDMDELASLLRPDVAIILNVGAGHTEGLGDRGVAWHKTRMLKYLSQDGMGLICADYPDLVHAAKDTGVPIQFFSARDAGVAYYAAYVGVFPDERGRGRYRLRYEDTEYEVSAPFQGQYGAEHLAAIAACAHLLGLEREDIVRGLAQASLPEQRFRELRKGKWLYIDDTYNANPLSMRCMLDAAAERAAGRPLIVVLGEMRELGRQSTAEHRTLGQHLARLHPEAVFWKGGQGDAVHSGLMSGDYGGLWLPVEDEAHFARMWEKYFASTPCGGLVLFKGSRGNHMEYLLATLTQDTRDRETVLRKPMDG